MRRILIVMMLLTLWHSTADAAFVCPPDHPHMRKIASNMQWCTLKACLGPVICEPNNTECRHGPVADCNTCVSAEPMILCLSDAELKKAEQPSR